MTVIQSLWLRKEDIPRLPNGWQALTTVEAADQLKPGKLYDQKTSSPEGEVPVVNQSLDGFVGYHSDEPGVFASVNKPVVTFANHTCAMRLMKQPFSCIQNIFPKVGREGVCDTRYFYYAAMGRVDLSDYKGHHPLFRQAYIPVPPLPTQQRIAAILSAYDDLIENNTRRIAILEEMARRLYEEWFVHFRFPGHEEVEFDGELPLGWRSVELGDVVEERRDSVKTDEIDPETPYVGLEHIPRRSITLREWSSASTVQSTKLRFAENDILFGKIRPYFHKVSLAPVEGVASSDTIILRAYSPEHLPLALCCASSDAFVDHATQTSNGTKMPRANWKVLTKYPVVIPDAQVLSGFNGFAQPLLSQLKLLNRKNANLRAQRDLLLPKLVSGEINVCSAEAALEAAE